MCIDIHLSVKHVQCLAGLCACVSLPSHLGSGASSPGELCTVLVVGGDVLSLYFSHVLLDVKSKPKQCLPRADFGRSS